MPPISGPPRYKLICPYLALFGKMSTYCMIMINNSNNNDNTNNRWFPLMGAAHAARPAGEAVCIYLYMYIHSLYIYIYIYIYI